MVQRFTRSKLASDGFSIVSVSLCGAHVRIQLRSKARSGCCPDCGRASERVQSLYIRRPADLPIGGHRVELIVLARRFWCDAVLCSRRIFCERFGG
nr:transposase family protein [Brucella intermedia]